MSEQFAGDHPARIVEEEVNRLDSRLLEAAYRGVGSKPHRPDLMLKMVMFEYLEGRLSPAQWTRDAREHRSLRWLGRGIQPSRSVWYRYRDRMARVIESVHENLLVQAQSDGFVDGGTAVQDGTSFRACASRHRVVNRATLLKRREALQEALQGDQLDEPQEQKQRPGWMAQTPSGRLEQAQRLERAQEVLEQRIEANAKRPKDKRLSEHQVRVSTSDPEAPLGRDKEKVFCPLYTAQFLVDPVSLLVICWDVFAQAGDAGTLPTMLDRAQQLVKGKLKKVLADAAYATLLDLRACLERGVQLIAPVQENSFTEKKRAAAARKTISREQFTWLPDAQTYRCPQGHVLDYRGKERRSRRGDAYLIQHRYHCPPEHCRGCELAGQCVQDANKGRTIKRLEGQEIVDAQRAMMSRPEVKEEYKQRAPVIERAFADAKRNRNFRQLHGRGLRRALPEVGLLVLAQNILTLHRLRRNRETPYWDTS